MPKLKKQPEDEGTAVAKDIQRAKQRLSARIDAALHHSKTQRYERKLPADKPG